MKATNKGGSFKPVALPKPQTTLARCFSIIDIGTVDNVYKGEVNGKVHKVMVSWELPKLQAVFKEEEGPKPFSIGLELTMSTKENSNFAKLIAQWRNKPLTLKEQEGFEVSKMLGKTALLSFLVVTKTKFKGQELPAVNSENSALKFNGIMPRPEEMPIPAAVNPTFLWDWEKIENKEEAFDEKKFLQIPEWLRKKMITSEEFQKFGRLTNPVTDKGGAYDGPETDTDAAPEGEW